MWEAPEKVPRTTGKPGRKRLKKGGEEGAMATLYKGYMGGNTPSFGAPKMFEKPDRGGAKGKKGGGD